MLLRRLQRLRGSGPSLLRTDVLLPTMKRKASNSFSAVQDTYLSTKEIFERHRVVFTISTSIASVLTAWAGYSLRYYHQSKVEERLESIEQAMKSKYDLEHHEVKEMVQSGNVSTATFLATAWTTLLVGYGFGWRGGSWYTNRKLQKEQLKALGQMKPNRWHTMRKSLIQSRIFGASRKPKGIVNPPTSLSKAEAP